MLRLMSSLVCSVFCRSPATRRYGCHGDRPRRVGLVCAILYLQTFVFLHRALSSVVAIGASLICNKIPGLAPKQRTICQGHPDAMVAAGEGARLAFNECRHQFSHQRWNCTLIDAAQNVVESPLGHISTAAGTKEMSYAYAIRSAGVAYAVTQACSLGNLVGCGCDKTKTDANRLIGSDNVLLQHSAASSSTPPGAPGGATKQTFRWGGCSADVTYGLRFSRVFLDARETEENSRSLMNLHNNRAGRKALRDTISTECKCHGISGSCSMRTCWITLPRFRLVGERLFTRYGRARPVEPIRGQRAMKPLYLRLKRRSSRRPSSPSVSSALKPVRRDLVYLDASPNYCELDQAVGSVGTRGRVCNRTMGGSDGCDSMCCGRGYDTRLYTRTWQCGCKFYYCCRVECRTCSERTDEYTCK